jgi:hypothetical protein
VAPKVAQADNVRVPGLGLLLICKCGSLIPVDRDVYKEGRTSKGVTMHVERPNSALCKLECLAEKAPRLRRVEAVNVV